MQPLSPPTPACAKGRRSEVRAISSLSGIGEGIHSGWKFSEFKMLAGGEASIDGATSFQRSSRACGWGSCRWGEHPGGMSPCSVRGSGVVGGEVVAAVSCDRLRCARQDGRAPQIGARSAPRVHHGAAASDAASDVARVKGRAGCAWGQSLAQCGLAVLASRRPALQKKLCSPLSRRAPTSPAGDSAGGRGRPALIPAAWSSSTRPGSRPAWPRYADGDPRARGCGALCRKATGAR